MPRFDRSFYGQPAQVVAPALVGAHLVRKLPGGGKAVGRVVEVEAYVGPEDLACHAAHGRTPRTEVMFGPPGRAYVFLVYGMHHCLNVVTDAVGHPAAVLIRALEPISGIEASTRGPGRLCKALQIDRSFNGADLLRGELYLEPGSPPRRVIATARIGVEYARHWARRKLRYIEAGSRWLS